MTKKQFIDMQARRWGIDPKLFRKMLKQQNLTVDKCNCGHKCCHGLKINNSFH